MKFQIWIFIFIASNCIKLNCTIVLLRDGATSLYICYCVILYNVPEPTSIECNLAKLNARLGARLQRPNSQSNPGQYKTNNKQTESNIIINMNSYNYR